MKQADLIKKLEAGGYKLKRHGGNHDVYTNGIHSIAVPRHREIKETTAKGILKEAGIY